MKEVRLYYVDSDVFGELQIHDADTLDQAIDDVQNEYANSGDIKIIERVYLLKEENEHIINTDW